MIDRPVIDVPTSNRRRRAGQLPLVIVLAASLVGASLLRTFVISGSASDQSRRPPTTGPTTNPAAPAEATFAATRQDFSQFNSYTLGLLLGGLRGPLVMTLWSTSEAQKSDRNLDDINTKIELIRLLQPEFDSVHLFQIWNKAYNLSVQMANLPDKYAMILDAIDYAKKARDERPENINIESAIGGIYFDKLGTSSEKQYYRERLREETMAPQGQVKITFPPARRDAFVAAALAAGADARRYTIRPESGGLLSARLRADYAKRVLAQFGGPDVTTETFPPRHAGVSRATMRNAADVLLDAEGRILPEYASRTRPADVADTDWRPRDGELAYLTRFEPYPYGVSPFALAYDYFKRAVALQVSRNQKHAQLSERIVSARPALALKNWADAEMERGRRAMMAQFGVGPKPGDDSETPFEAPTAPLKPGPITSTPLIEEAQYSYDRAAQLAARAVIEYREHIKRYPEDLATYRSHVADVRALSEYAAADAAYAKLMTTVDPTARAALGREAAQHYAQAIDFFARIALAFYAPDELMSFPKGYGKADVLNSLDTPASFPADQLLPMLAKARAASAKSPYGAISELEEYTSKIARAQARLALLKTATTQP